MPLSWNEIKTRATAFAKEWENEVSEDAEAKSFWDGFFDVFGITRRRIASFETAVKKLGNKQGFIDLFWPGQLLVEHKSRGKDLDRAFAQAMDYFPGLKEHELPRFILVSDFERFRLYNLEERSTHEFPLRELVQNVHLFGFVAGYERRTYKEEDPVNIQAAERMGNLHDRLEEVGYTGHALELYLVRILFCLFAEDTGIFERTQFQEFVEGGREDGSDLAMRLANLFQVLDTPPDKRLKTLDESLAAFPYVNGKLFEEMLPFAAFDSKMREMLLLCCALDWSKISPAIFGSMFQAVMNPKERRNLGAHYTSEKNIQKVIKPLFLDDLHAEFEKAKGSRPRLNELHQKIASLHFLDPACGCGNFLIISYRELRELELLILRELNKGGQGFLDVREIIRVDVDQFAGIEYDEFPARIAEVAMWLIDHQMNRRVSDEFGQYFVRLPLQKAAKIVHGNALRIDWEEVVPSTKLNYILGNPPFIGKQHQNEEQKADMAFVWEGKEGAGVLDYVTAWYIKAANYVNGYNNIGKFAEWAKERNEDYHSFVISEGSRMYKAGIKCAFVSTNSIAQGEQVGILWNELFNNFNVKIYFAHRTFCWSNEAKGNAAVHVVIIGFGITDVATKRIFDYSDIKGEPQEHKVKNINPYLVEGNDVVILKRRKPISSVPQITFGSMPNDGGYLLLDDVEKEELIKREPGAEKWIRPLLSAKEYLNGVNRWSLWLSGIQPQELKQLKLVSERVEKVRIMRSESSREATRKLAVFPTLFGENRQPNTDFILIPLHSSENRKYIPLGFFDKSYIANNSTSVVSNATLYHFGVLTSEIHMVWVKYTCGRIKSDFRYSNEVVYNNYPFPLNPTDAQKKKVEDAAQAVLDTRAKYPGSSLADLYDPVTMPPDLVKAHQVLDKAVDLCYRAQPFASELARIEYLFGLYEQYTAPMFSSSTKKKK